MAWPLPACRVSSSQRPSCSGYSRSGHHEPPRPCSCGESHLYKDCAKRSSRVNVTRSFPSPTNRIPITNSRWPYSASPRRAQQLTITSPEPKAEAHINLANIDHDVHPVASPGCLPVQDNDGYADLYQALCNDIVIALDEPSILPLAKDKPKQQDTDATRPSAMPSLTTRTKFVSTPDPPPPTNHNKPVTNEKDHLEKDFRKDNDVSEVDQDPILTCESNVLWDMAEGIGQDPALQLLYILNYGIFCVPLTFFNSSST